MPGIEPCPLHWPWVRNHWSPGKSSPGYVSCFLWPAHPRPRHSHESFSESETFVWAEAQAEALRSAEAQEQVGLAWDPCAPAPQLKENFANLQPSAYSSDQWIR